MKHVILDNAKSPPKRVDLADLSFEEMAHISGGGYFLYPTYRFWTGVYDGFTAGFGSWVQNGHLK